MPDPQATGQITPVPSLRRNASLLLVGNAVGLAAPLITVPYLARVLRPEGWAPVLLAQVLAAWLVLVLEYGFDLSGARVLAQGRDDRQRLGQIVTGVQTAKLLLAPLTALLLAAAVLTNAQLRAAPALVAWTLAYVVLRGFNPLWFFQGVERLGVAVVLDAGSKLVAALAVLVVVQEPTHAPRVLALQAAGAALTTLVLSVRMYALAPWQGPSLAAGREMLRAGRHLFGFRVASGMFAALNVVLVGIVSSPLAVALFGGADRLVRAAIGVISAFTQAVLPRVSFLAGRDADAAERLVQRSMLVTGGFGLGVAAIAVVLAPQLVALLLGPGYEGAVPVIRVLALVAPLIAFDTVLGLHWAIPHGHDRSFLRIILVGGGITLGLLAAATPRYGPVGAAAAVVLGEAVILFSLLALRRRARAS